MGQSNRHSQTRTFLMELFAYLQEISAPKAHNPCDLNILICLVRKPVECLHCDQEKSKIPGDENCSKSPEECLEGPRLHLKLNRGLLLLSVCCKHTALHKLGPVLYNGPGEFQGRSQVTRTTKLSLFQKKCLGMDVRCTLYEELI